MGIFDKVLGGKGGADAPFNKQEAFTGVLLSAIAADGVITPEEMQNFGTAVCRMRLYKGMSGSAFSSMADKLINLMRKNGLEFVLDKSIAGLPAELKETAFAAAADLVFADGSIEKEEKVLLEKLYKALGVSDALAVKILEVIEIKNRG